MDALTALVNFLMDDVRQYTSNRRAKVQFYVNKIGNNEAARSIDVTAAKAAVSEFRSAVFYAYEATYRASQVTARLRINFELTAIKYQSSVDFTMTMEDLLFSHKAKEITEALVKARIEALIEAITAEIDKINRIVSTADNSDGEYDAILKSMQMSLKWLLETDNLKALVIVLKHQRVTHDATSASAAAEDAKPATKTATKHSLKSVSEKKPVELENFITELMEFLFETMRNAHIDSIKASAMSNVPHPYIPIIGSVYTRKLPSSEYSLEMVKRLRFAISDLDALGGVEDPQRRLSLVNTNIQGLLRSFETCGDSLSGFIGGNEFVDVVISRLNVLFSKGETLENSDAHDAKTKFAAASLKA